MTDEEFRKELLLRTANLSKEEKEIIVKIIGNSLTKENGSCYTNGEPIKCKCKRTLAVKVDGEIFIKCPKCKNLHKLHIQS